jgi:predicted nucleotidyltransferase
MIISGIAAEYNPFHLGHAYHIAQTKKVTGSDAVIIAMSGNFVQRGLPAIFDKMQRTRMALLNGADIVFELPCIYSLSSAEFFALGAVSLFKSLGCVDYMSFGSEVGDVTLLNSIAEILTIESKDFSKSIKRHLSTGLSYPCARKLALCELFPTKLPVNFDEIISSPNNVLGIEYCKQLLKLNSTIKPITIKRSGDNYHDLNLNENFSSATSIRRYLLENKNIDILKNELPLSVYKIILSLINDGYDFAKEDKMVKYLNYKKVCMDFKGNDMEKLPDISEGLQNRISSNISSIKKYSEIIKDIKTKRYTYTRISRILCQYFIGFDDFNTKILRSLPCPYARILGFTGVGASILKKMKSSSSIPLFSKLPRDRNEILKLELQATRAYSLINSSIDPLSDFNTFPIIID